MVIIDTTVWIDYLRGTGIRRHVWLDRELQRQRLGLTDLILCEVLQGIREQSAFARVRADLLKFQVFEIGGMRLGHCGRSELPRLAPARLHRSQDHRLPDRHFLLAGQARTAAPGSGFRWL